MSSKPSMSEAMRQRFYEQSRGPRRFDAGDRLRPPDPGETEPIDDGPEPPPRSALDEDPILLWQETEIFGSRPRGDSGETLQRPVAIHLGVLAVVLWLGTIDPVWRALTPRNFSGIPAPQLMAVFFIGPILWCVIFWAWAKLLPAYARVFLRTQLTYWKRWLVVAWAASLVVRNL